MRVFRAASLVFGTVAMVGCGGQDASLSETAQAPQQATLRHHKHHPATDADLLTRAGQCAAEQIELATLAQQRATTPEVRQYATDTAECYKKVASEIKALADKKGLTVTPGLSAEGAHHWQKLAKHQGHRFERKYLRHAAKSDAKGIAACHMAIHQADDHEVKAWFAAQVVGLEEHAQYTHDVTKHRAHQQHPDKGTAPAKEQPGPTSPDQNQNVGTPDQGADQGQSNNQPGDQGNDQTDDNDQGNSDDEPVVDEPSADDDAGSTDDDGSSSDGNDGEHNATDDSTNQDQGQDQDQHQQGKTRHFGLFI